MSVAIIDYGSGNLRSAAKAFERAEGEAGLNLAVTVTRDPDILKAASHIVLPGVGAFADCRRGLDALDGMVEALEEQVIKAGKPFLGICVGMQLMASMGREHQNTPGMNWIEGEVVALDSYDKTLKIPHPAGGPDRAAGGRAAPPGAVWRGDGAGGRIRARDGAAE
mgnify:CR=1 FL=1